MQKGDYGYKQILEQGHFAKEEILSIFIAAEADVLIQRLINRGTETKEKILRRLETARKECDYIPLYDSVIMNETKEQSLKRLEVLIEREEKITDYFDVDLFKEQVEKSAFLF